MFSRGGVEHRVREEEEEEEHLKQSTTTPQTEQ